MSQSRRTRQPRQDAKGPLWWPLVLVIIGGLLLLGNFLLLGDFNVMNLWPLLLVIIGAQILLRGDVLAGDEFRTFGITRGSVESATLEINAAEIDVALRSLRGGQERLIAGQYAWQSRPYLQTEGVHAHLTLQRRHTPWLSFADWEMGLARNLPWEIFVSTHLGQVELNLDGLIIDRLQVHTGIGAVQFTCPDEALGEIHISSTLGNVTIMTPPGHRAVVHMRGGRFVTRHVDEARYEQIEPDSYAARDADDHAPVIEITVQNAFGDIFLA